MVLLGLGDKLKQSLRKLVRAGHVNEALLREVLNDVQRALIMSDVDVELVLKLTDKVREKARETKSFNKKEVIIQSIYEELTKILGTGTSFKITTKPCKVLLIGLFGSGKTTTAVKLANYLKKRGYKTSVLGLDTFRAGAMHQLEQLCNKKNIPVMINKKEKNPVKIIKEFSKKFKNYDVIITDSAGRSALDKELMKEIKSINKELKPDYTFLVLPADIGQNAKKQTIEFKNALYINGVIITKLDGSAKGGGALSACAQTNTNVEFIGVGEGVDDFREFEPKRFVSKLLGMGDLEELLEKAKQVISEDKALKLQERFLSGEFNLMDFYEQIESITNMGSLQKILNLIPGLGMTNIPKDLLGVQEEKMKEFKTVMQSMTREELEHPEIIKASRVARISKGSGVSEDVVRELLKQYKRMKKIIKKFKGMNVKKLGKMKGLNTDFAKLMKQFKKLKGL